MIKPKRRKTDYGYQWIVQPFVDSSGRKSRMQIVGELRFGTTTPKVTIRFDGTPGEELVPSEAQLWCTALINLKNVLTEEAAKARARQQGQ